jgi:hypothetical protein
MGDALATRKPVEIATFYSRLADSVDRNRGALKVSLAASLMRHWLENRDATSTFEFEAPEHLRNRKEVQEVFAFHRRVFLTQEKAHFTGGITKWAGVVPRLRGNPPFPKWDTKSPLSMDYESLVEIPLRYQLTGDEADKDILYALRGFQLKSHVVITAASPPREGKLRINFQSFDARIRDRYDWDYSEHLTVPNPDYGSTTAGAIEPTSKSVVVYHRNAKRLEDAGLAAPYDVQTKPWQVGDAQFRAPADVNLVQMQ